MTGFPREAGSQPAAKAARTPFSIMRGLICGRRSCGCNFERRADGIGNSMSASRCASRARRVIVIPLHPSAVHHCGSRWMAQSYCNPSTSTVPDRSRVWSIRRKYHKFGAAIHPIPDNAKHDVPPLPFAGEGKTPKAARVRVCLQGIALRHTLTLALRACPSPAGGRGESAQTGLIPANKCSSAAAIHAASTSANTPLTAESGPTA